MILANFISNTNSARFVSDGGTDDTTADGKQAFAFLGDSWIEGSNNTNGPGPTPTAGTAYQYNGTTVVEIQNADVYNVVAGGGTCMPKFCIDYNTKTGSKAVCIPLGSGGSEFYPNGDNNNWYSSGTRRGVAQTQISGCLTALGLVKLKGAFLSLGINDFRSANNITDIRTGIDSFFLWWTTTYPGIPIYVAQIGFDGSNLHVTKQYQIAERILYNAQLYPDVKMFFNNRSLIGAGGRGADNLHPNQVGQDFMGASAARAAALEGAGYSKWTQSILSSWYSDITTTRKNLLETCVTSIGAELFKLESLHWLKVSTANDIFCDLTFLGYGTNSSAVVNLNDNVSTTSGSSHSFITAFNPSVNILRAGQNDVFYVAKIKTNASAGSAALFGVSTPLFRLSQAASGVFGSINSTTALTYETETTFQSNQSYGIARNGASQIILKNGASVDSDAVASTGLANRQMRNGAIDQGTVSSYITCQYEYVLGGKYSTINLSAVLSALNTMAAAW